MGGTTGGSPDPAYDELDAWTLGPAGYACHQHVVDAHAAQAADGTTRPITLVFALAGLYLHLERGWDGSAVQRGHQRMAARRRTWPRLAVPAGRGALTAADALAVPEPGRPAAVDAWCASVWAAYREQQPAIRELVADLLPG